MSKQSSKGAFLGGLEMKINLCAFILVLLLSSTAFADEEIIAHGKNPLLY